MNFVDIFTSGELALYSAHTYHTSSGRPFHVACLYEDVTLNTTRTYLNIDFVHNLQRHGEGTSEELRHSHLAATAERCLAIFKVILTLTQCNVGRVNIAPTQGGIIMEPTWHETSDTR